MIVIKFSAHEQFWKMTKNNFFFLIDDTDFQVIFIPLFRYCLINQFQIRYNVVAEPFRRTTYARARVTVALTWVYGATFAGLPLVIPSLGRYKPEGYLTSCSFDYLTSEPWVKAFILCFFVGAWVLPFCLISFCYIGIIRVVMVARHMNIGDQVIETSKKHCREEEKRKTELRCGIIPSKLLGNQYK